jgi:integrase/recombinase XerD
MPFIMAPPRFLYVANRRNPDQPGFIVCRVTVDKVKYEFATGKRCHREDWQLKEQEIRGKSPEVKTANSRLKAIRHELEKLSLEKDNAKLTYTAESLVREWQGSGEAKKTLLQVWALFIEKRKPLAGISLSQAKLDADQVRLDHVTLFLKQQRLSGLLPDAFTANLADDFRTYLRTTRHLSQNYTSKVIQTVKQVLSWSVLHKHSTKQPLEKYKLSFAPPKPAKHLSEAELTRLRDFSFSSRPLRVAADCFLFQCYTGLAYVDLARFRQSQHTRFIKGHPWLCMERQKTQHSSGQVATVPLLPVAQQLLAVYGERLPVPANQVYNRFLKEIAAVLGFDDLGLTSHVGRKTAGSQFLAAGFSLEAVSKMLGHSNVLITQRHYVNLNQDLVSREFSRVYGNNKQEPA